VALIFGRIRANFDTIGSDGDRDDLVDTPSLRGGRLVRHGGSLRRQRLDRSFRAGLYDGKI